jgi:hypothetical protein
MFTINIELKYSLPKKKRKLSTLYTTISQLISNLNLRTWCLLGVIIKADVRKKAHIHPLITFLKASPLLKVIKDRCKQVHFGLNVVKMCKIGEHDSIWLRPSKKAIF